MLKLVNSSLASGITSVSGLTKLQLVEFFSVLYPGQAVSKGTLYEHAKQLQLGGYSTVALSNVQRFFLLWTLKQLSGMTYAQAVEHFRLSPENNDLSEQWRITEANTDMTREKFDRKLTEFYISLAK